MRSRHLYYMNSNGYWEYDGLSDFSRIQRQDAFFRAVLAKINSSITNPLAINAFIGAAVGNLTIDDTLTQGDLLHIADVFRGLPSSHLVTETLPTWRTPARRGRRAEGGAALRPERDQRRSTRSGRRRHHDDHDAEPRAHKATTTTTTAPTEPTARSVSTC